MNLFFLNVYYFMLNATFYGPLELDIFYSVGIWVATPPSPHYLAEKWRVREEERERRMSGPIVFPPHSALTTGRGVFSCCTSSSPSSFSLAASKNSLSESSFIIYSSSLNFPPFFLITGFTSSVQSCMVAGIRKLPFCAPSFPPNLLSQFQLFCNTPH